MASPRRNNPPKVMLDANILIAGTVWPRWSYEILDHAIKGDFQLVLSEYVINQARRRITKRFPAYLERFEQFLEQIDYQEPPQVTEEMLAQSQGLVRDATDLPVALAAIKAQVDCLVSEDKDLTAQDETTEELRKYLKVYLSGTFLRVVMGWTSEELEAIRKRKWADMTAGN